MLDPHGRVQLLFRHTHTHTAPTQQRAAHALGSRSMAMISDTGSSFAQWAALYNSHHDEPVLSDDADIAIGTTTAAAAASPTSGGSSGGGSPTPTKAARAGTLHGVEGPRIGKPAAGARRRSRASRRAPVTLLNTDTANFRAMVQQFTGIPAPPAGATFGNHPLINFAADYGFPPPSSVMSFNHNHQQQLHQPAPRTLQEQQELIRRQQQQQYTGGAPSSPFGYGGNGVLHGGGGGGDVFASHGFAASSAEDRMLLQSIQAAQQMPSTHMAPVSAANTITTNGFY